MLYQNSQNGLVSPAIDPNDPEVRGRQFHPVKGSFKSKGNDPWMKSSFTVCPAFLKWLMTERQQSRNAATSLANLKAEIRNDFVRAGDLWADFQEHERILCEREDLDSDRISKFEQQRRERSLSLREKIARQDAFQQVLLEQSRQQRLDLSEKSVHRRSNNSKYNDRDSTF